MASGLGLQLLLKSVCPNTGYILLKRQLNRIRVILSFLLLLLLFYLKYS